MSEQKRIEELWEEALLEARAGDIFAPEEGEQLLRGDALMSPAPVAPTEGES